MNAATPHLSRKYQHPALQGLSEKELTAILNNCVTRLLPASAPLFHAGEPATADYLLLDGAAALKNPRQDSPPISLTAGDYVPSGLFQDEERCLTHDCVMESQGTVLVIPENVKAGFDERLQLALHTNLQALNNRLACRLIQHAGEAQAGGQRGPDLVQEFLTRQQLVYQNAVALQAMLANLPRLPPYTSKLTTLLNDPQANTRMIVDIARQDPSLTASVLKTVNSPYYGFTHKIKDFQHAVMMLGFTQIQQLLMGTGVNSIMPNAPEFRQLQAHSMMISVLANEISLTLKAGSAAVLSTLGILHDIGKSVVLLLRRQYPGQDFLMSLLDPDMVGTLLLREWKLADNITDALQYQSFPCWLPPEAIPAAHRSNVAVLHLAHSCLDLLRNNPQQASASVHFAKYLAELGTPEQDVNEFLVGRLIPSITDRRSVLPLALQDMLKKAALGNQG